MIEEKKYISVVRDIDFDNATKDIKKYVRACKCVSWLSEIGCHKAFNAPDDVNFLMRVIGYMYSATCLLATDKFRDFMYVFGHNTLLKVLEYYQSPEIEDYETCAKIVKAIKSHNKLVKDNLKTT